MEAFPVNSAVAVFAFPTQTDVMGRAGLDLLRLNALKSGRLLLRSSKEAKSWPAEDHYGSAASL